MKLPRDLSGDEIVKGLRRVAVKTGTLGSILGSVSSHLRIDRDELLRRMKV